MKANQNYLDGLIQDMRSAVVKFRHYDRMWNELNEAFKEKIRTENQIRTRNGRYPHTALGVAQQKEAALALKDAMSAAQWWREKAAMLSSVIQAEQMMRGDHGWEPTSPESSERSG